jgi:hypothetical protein
MKKIICTFILLLSQQIFASDILKLYPWTTVRYAMNKYNCHMKVLSPIYINKGKEMIKVGSIEFHLKKADYKYKRVLLAGREIPLNHIEEDFSGYNFDKVFSDDKTIDYIFDLDFWDNTIPDFSLKKFKKRANDKLEIRCRRHVLLEA